MARNAVVVVFCVLLAVVVLYGYRLGSHDAVFPPMILVPLIIEMLNFARLRKAGKSLKRVAHYAELLMRVLCFTGGVPKGEVQINGARWVNGASNGVRAGHAQGWDATAFDFASDQSNGLMTYRSDRYHKRDVHFVSYKSVSDCRCQDVCNFASRVNTPHKGVSIFAEAT